MSKKKLGIIVPIRDRNEELYKFSAHMQWFLADKMDYTIYFIEQHSPDLFNYGSLCNVGYKLLKDECDYFIFHDVNLIPITDNCDYSDQFLNPIHMASNISDIKNGKPYPHYIGGVFKISKEDFEKINGFSNDYWDGGFEYMDLLWRMNKYNVFLPTIKFFDKDIYKPHRLIDVTENEYEVTKKLTSFEFSDGDSLMIKSNPIVDNLFQDSFTLSFDAFINGDLTQDGTLIAKEGYDVGLFIKNNEAMVFQHWFEDGELIQIWWNHSDIKDKWAHITLRFDTVQGIVSLFINGSLVDEVFFDTSKLLMDFSQKDIWLGSLFFKNKLNGKISNLLCFDYALSDTEIDLVFKENYDKGLTTFEPIIDISFNKMVGQFYIDTASLKNHARQILISNHKKIVEEDFQYSYKFNMPESDIGKFKVLENSEKFTILDNYNYETPNPNFIENENIFFYESVKSKNKDIPKFGLSSVSYKIMGETKIDKNIKKISVKLN
jgi:hypothetical protein